MNFTSRSSSVIDLTQLGAAEVEQHLERLRQRAADAIDPRAAGVPALVIASQTHRYRRRRTSGGGGGGGGGGVPRRRLQRLLRAELIADRDAVDPGSMLAPPTGTVATRCHEPALDGVEVGSAVH
jgi:hypothetical protein